MKKMLNRSSLFRAILCLALMVDKVSGFGGAWSWYRTMLIEQPLVTKSLTSCGTNAFSDALCQKLAFTPAVNNDEKKFEIRRFVDAAITGLVWSGPVTHFWYKLLFGK